MIFFVNFPINFSMIFKFFLIFCFFTNSGICYSTCSFSNDRVDLSWKVKNSNNLTLNFEYQNLKDGQWAAIAFGNGPGMKNLEAIIFKRKANEIIVKTGFTPRKGKVILDRIPYVQINNSNIHQNILQISLSRPLGEAGPRNFSLNQCIDWAIVPGSRTLSRSQPENRLMKHHGKAFKIKNVCAAKCEENQKKSINLDTNRIIF